MYHEIPLSALASKPSPSPESRDSPRIHARQRMTSPDPGGGLSDSTSRRKSGRSGLSTKTKLIRPARATNGQAAEPQVMGEDLRFLDQDLSDLAEGVERMSLYESEFLA